MVNIALIAAGGIGSRLGNKSGKQLLEVNGKPILVWTLELFQKAEKIDSIVVVIKKEDVSKISDFKNKYNFC